MVIDKALNPDPKRKPEKAFKFASDFDKFVRLTNKKRKKDNHFQTGLIPKTKII
jgi:hypothetical protein